MADGTSIEWTDATWNPIRARDRDTGKLGWFCTHASPGCANCYAEPINRRLGTGVDYKPGHLDRIEVFLDEAALLKPLSWRRPRVIFVGSMTDLFGDFVTDEMLDRVFAVMALCPQHVLQVLTKRQERMRAYLSRPATARRVWELACDMVVEHGFGVTLLAHPSHASLAPAGRHVHVGRWPVPNVWLGVSVEDQRRADERIPVLLETPAAVRWISAEPLLGAINLRRIRIAPNHHTILDALDGYAIASTPTQPGRPARTMLDWVVAGGESGPGARPMHPDWARGLRDQCATAGVPFLFKQWGEWAPICEIGESDDLYHPAPEQHPEARRRCRHANLVMHDDGAIFDLGTANDYHRRVTMGAFAAGSKAMTMFAIGKKAAGRLLDGVTHDGFPEARR